MNFRRWITALAVLALFAGFASAQIQNSNASSGPFQCNAGVAVPPVLRAEGLTELVGDIVLTGIGRDSGGASSAQVAQKLMDALVNGAIKSASSLGNLVGNVGDKAKGLIPGDAGGAVKGLFGK